MLLEFEKPIALLEDKLILLRKEAIEGKQRPGLTNAIEKLEKEIKTLQEEVFSSLTPWQRVQLSRHPDRPYTLDFISRISENFIELYGDRYHGEDKAIVGGFGSLENQTVMFIGHQKGRTTKERQFRRFGMPNPEGYRKALRLMKLAEKFNKPIINFIDTPGAYPGIEAEERGQGRAIAMNIQNMFSIKVPILVIIIGEGASGGALGLGIGDKTYMLENTWYSVISPESCSAILWKTWNYKEQAASNLNLTAKEMLKNKLIDEIIKEPLGGAHRNIPEIADRVKNIILKDLECLKKITPTKRIEQKINKFSNMGVFKS
ncbi:MAG: acetyl-CoA carboxylase carboxyltransferase subunit alpha [Bacteroidetes bacterium]|nr:acetyl-CoA carboxylase carboxyltransferase subunit alpha [Bacteroidota bacterium]